VRKIFFFFFISVPGKHDDHDHDVADEPQDEDPEIGHKEQEDHAGGHDQRLLDLVTADQTGNDQWLFDIVTADQTGNDQWLFDIVTADQTGNTWFDHHWCQAADFLQQNRSKEQEDHAGGHDQRLLNLVTADQTGNTWLCHHS
jgi:hypothetical protein